jgi:hypothetical protein
MKSILLAGAVFLALCLPNGVNAQNYRYPYNGLPGTIDPGTAITVRTLGDIDTNRTDGRVFSGAIEQDVMDNTGNIVIPRGSMAELMVRRLSNNQVALDLESIDVAGQRYAVETSDIVKSQEGQGLGANKRTGEYLGGGAILGAIIGAIAGGGKGAAIGAAGGAAAGAGVQVLTQGRTVRVPAESLLTFQLTQPLYAGVMDNGYYRNGQHYHRYGTNQQQTYNNGRYGTNQQQAYNNGRYGNGNYGRQKPGYYGANTGSVHIGADQNISWDGPADSSVWVQADGGPLKLFARGASGTERAPWMLRGHTYTFILKDAYGNEIAVDQADMRY